MRPALDWAIPPLGITRALGAVAATAITTAAAGVTRNHAAPGGAVPAADIAGVAPEGPVPGTHHDPGPPDNAAISHNPAEGIDPTTGVGLDPQEGVLVINPILQIINVPGILQSLWTGSDVEWIETLIPSHKPITDQVAKIVCS